MGLGMDTVVMKFGGASCAKPSYFSKIAKIILEKKKKYHVIAVISAMRGMTNSLLDLAHEVYPEAPKREKDMLLSVGERVSSSLLAMALSKEGSCAISFTGSQSGIITTNAHTEAHIVDVKPYRIQKGPRQGVHCDRGGISGGQRGERCDDARERGLRYERRSSCNSPEGLPCRIL